MTIRFSCGDCGKDYKVPAQYAGKRVKCKKCGVKIKVPSADGESAKTSKRSSSASKKTSARRKKASARTEKASSSGKSKRSETATTPKPSATKSDKASARRKSRPSKRSGNGTEVIDVPDIEKERKKYESKKKEEKKMPRGTGRLVYFVDGKAVKSYRLNGDIQMIGSGADCDVHIDDNTVSQEHCKLEVRLGKFIATDMRSSNGLVVNSKKVRRASLNNGDIIQLGHAVFRIDCG